MRISRMILMAVLVVLLIVGCSSSEPIISDGGTAGSGTVGSAPRDVSGFRSIVLTGNGRVVVRQTGSDSVSVSVDDNLLPYMTAEVKDGQLMLGQSQSFETQQEVRFDVTVKDLDAIELRGSGDIDLMDIATSQLKIAIGGEGNVTGMGRADRLELTITGAGNYQGESMQSKTGVITIPGSGGALVNVSETLDVTIKGSGNIAYIGTPKVNQQVSGSGTVAPYVPETGEEE